MMLASARDEIDNIENDAVLRVMIHLFDNAPIVSSMTCFLFFNFYRSIWVQPISIGHREGNGAEPKAALVRKAFGEIRCHRHVDRFQSGIRLACD